MARIGMVNFINTAPVYEVWKEKVHRPDWQVTEAAPSTLNRMLASGQLDLGVVSSCEYARHPDEYRIMADLSISATGPVGSVFLFSRLNWRDLDGKLVLLTGQSDTSVCLVKIVLEDFFKVRPRYATGNVFGPETTGQEVSAVLAIGDEALRLKLENRFPLDLDLAEIWHETTGLPFVFAIYAVRNEFIRSSAATVREIRSAFLRCREEGLRRLSEISSRVAARIPMDPEACRRYLSSMDYDLDEEKLKGLETFYSYLIKHGDASNGALPLKIFS